MQEGGNAGRSVAASAPAGSDAFEAFVRDVEPRLRRALVAAYGFEDGRDAAAEALGYAWEHWERLHDMANLPGYLYRVGQSRRRRFRGVPVLSDRSGWDEDRFEPGYPKHWPRCHGVSAFKPEPRPSSATTAVPDPHPGGRKTPETRPAGDQ